MNKQALERMTVARIAMLMNKPFFGTMATRLQLVEDNDIPTAATDGDQVYYNADFINSQLANDKECEFVMGHETLHVIFDHLGRRDDLGHNPAISNLAADYVVNDVCKTEGIGTFPSKIPVLWDAKYSGWTYEEVYEDLMKNANKLDLESLSKKVLDKHMSPDMTPEERKAKRDEMVEAMISAAKMDPGSVPGAIKRLLDDLLESKMAWQDLLNSTCEAQLKTNTTWMKPNRRSFSTDFVMPTLLRDVKVSVTLGLDMSGSIGRQEQIEFFSEVKGIIEQFGQFDINVFCWDTQVYNYQTFTEDNVDDLMSYEPMGGGGTSLDGVFEWMKENEIEPEQLVIFTDGEICGWGDSEYCDTLFIIKNSRKIQAPYGLTVKY